MAMLFFQNSKIFDKINSSPAVCLDATPGCAIFYYTTGSIKKSIQDSKLLSFWTDNEVHFVNERDLIAWWKSGLKWIHFSQFGRAEVSISTFIFLPNWTIISNYCKVMLLKRPNITSWYILLFLWLTHDWLRCCFSKILFFVPFWKSVVLSRFQNRLLCRVLNVGCFVSF